MSVRLAILGSTGSIGRQALDVAARRRDRVEVRSLAAGRDLDALEAQARAVRPAMLALEHAADEPGARSLRPGPGSTSARERRRSSPRRATRPSC